MSGVEVGTAYLTVIPSAQGFATRLQSEMAGGFSGVERQADDSGKKSGSKMGKGLGAGALAAVKGFAGPLAAAAGALAAIDFLGGAVDGARESQRVSRLTEQTIRATGGAAKVSAAQVGELASALSKKTGIDDEAIQTGSNLLLTFKNIRNEAGAGNDVFNQATAAALDLSKSGFGSIDSASKMLGKALNDPVKGMSALSRAGVTFTDQQKEQVKALVATGDTLGAQKIILGEIETQVGGNAEATATATDKMKVAWGNLQEKVGEKLLPILDRLATWFTETAIPALERFGGWLGDVFGGVLGEAGDSVIDFDSILADIQPALDLLGVVLETIGDILADFVIPTVSALASVVFPLLGKAIGLVGEAGRWLWNNVFQPVFRFLVQGASKVLTMFGDMLSVLSRVPGFEWAGEAATAMYNAAGKAEMLADKIRQIPSSKTITIGINFNPYQSRIKVGDQYINVGLREHGGPVRKGQPYIVGERRPELFVPDQNGTIIPQVPGTYGAAAQGNSYHFNGDLAGDPDQIAEAIERRARRRQALELSYA